MKRKLSKIDVCKIKNINKPKNRLFCYRLELEGPSKYNLVFACTKATENSMVFWCPFCCKEHTHGLEEEPFVISPRNAHCHDPYGFPLDGYYVFWNGK